LQSLYDCPGTLVETVQTLTRELLPSAGQVKATYQDDEGDACTLTKDTEDDALAQAVTSDGDIRLLEVSVSSSDHLEATPMQKQVEPPIVRSFKRASGAFPLFLQLEESQDSLARKT